MNDRGQWYLDGYVDGERLPRRISITHTPFRIGRGTGSDARLNVHHVSDLHAEIYSDGDALRLRDHYSSNGTFRNRERVVDDVPLAEGDIIHVSTNEFVLRREANPTIDIDETVTLSAVKAELPANFVGGTQELREMLDRKEVVPHFQPLVRLNDALELIGYEILGRGSREGLPTEPEELFAIAEVAGLEVELSQLFRRRGLYQAQVLDDSATMFVNSHPSEIGSGALLDSLCEARKLMPDTDIVFETHESAVRSTVEMKNLRAALSDLGIGLAYDDFGSGEARLIELVEVPPDLLKFDTSLIAGIDKAPVSRQKMLETLVKMVNDLGIKCLAEGIETGDELRICRELGFGYGQGYFLGRPAPAHTWLRPVSSASESAAHGDGVVRPRELALPAAYSD